VRDVRGTPFAGLEQADNTSHEQVRARVEHTFARMKMWKILRDCRLRGDGVRHAMLGIAQLRNLTLAGQTNRQDRPTSHRPEDHSRDSPY
jgi:hypothetical protein